MVEGCYHCKLLYPGRADPCPVCGGGLRFTPAQMMGEELIADLISADVADCRSAGGSVEYRARLIRLLRDMMVHGGYAVQMAAEDGMDLDTLRREYKTGDGT